jgi:hypothetical protein
VLAASAAPAAAKPRYAHGFYAEGGAGASFLLADGAAYIAPGPAFQLRSGYDLFTWLSVGGRFDVTMHEATVPPPPVGEYFQFWNLAATARLSLRIQRIALFAEGGLGLGYVNTNVLDKVDLTQPDEYLSPLFTAGGGLDIHTRNRHFSYGLGADYTTWTGFGPAQGITVRLYLRYVL